MFEHSSVMIIRIVNKTIEINRLELENDTQTLICQSFYEAANSLVSEKSRVIFDGNYKPNDDEFLSIENF